jgi:hypothetical protein
VQVAVGVDQHQPILPQPSCRRTCRYGEDVVTLRGLPS